MSEAIKSFRDLRVYQASFKLQQQIFKLTKTFPKEEQYSLVDQVRRSSRSIGANISESWHKRRYIAHFVSKLTDADGEQAETQHWVDTAYACGYLDQMQQEALMSQLLDIGRKLGSMISKPEKFCRQDR